MVVHEKGTLLDIVGLSRVGAMHSAIIDIDRVYLLSLKSAKQLSVIFPLGGTVVEGKGAKRLLQLMPGEHLYLFFEAIDDLQPHSLRYVNWSGQPDSYFDVIDPRFRERYNSSYSAATAPLAGVEDMRNFLQEFAKNDPEMRAEKVFISMINKLHSINTFDGYFQAYQLLRDPTDEKAARRLARTPEQLSKLDAAVYVVKQAEAAKKDEIRKAQEARLAELRKRDEARQAELKKQEELKLAEHQAHQAKADEEKCMRTPACRKAWEIQQAKCEQEILSCRSHCDTVTGNNRSSGFLAGLSSSFLARGCYSACTCDSGLGVLLGKFNSAVAEVRSSSGAANKDSQVLSGRASAQKTFQCKVYCRGSDKPLAYDTVKAASRREAAKIISDKVDLLCSREHGTEASRKDFSESQCWEK